MRVVLALITFVLTTSPAHAVDGPLDRATLKGLTGVHVLLEDFTERAKRAGFDKRTFQTDVELKLRMAGVIVLNKTEAMNSPGKPTLTLTVTALPSRSGAPTTSTRRQLRSHIRSRCRSRRATPGKGMSGRSKTSRAARRSTS